MVKNNKKREASQAKKAGTVSKVSAKLHNDGKAIAGLEEAVHNLKNGPHRPGLQRGFNNIPRLLGSVEEQETAWILALTNCRKHAARVPVSQVTGAVPVDLYRRTEFDIATTNANDECFVMTQADQWNWNSTLSPPALLHADASQSTYGTVTGAAYVGLTFPNPGVLPTGGSAMILGNVSSDFLSNADTGTEYIMVANITTIRANMVAAAAADARYSGTVTAFYTLDVERHPIAGAAWGSLRATAMEENSSVFAQRYIITADGFFVPEDEPNAEPMSEISTVSLPLSKEAYEWRRIGATSLASIANTASASNVGFHIEAPSGTSFETETTYLYQTERYASNKVTTVDPVFDAAGALLHEGNKGGYLGSGMTYEQFHNPPGSEEFVVVHSGKSQKISRPVSSPAVIRHARYHGGAGAPPVALTFGNAVAPVPGKPIAPALAPMAVIEAAQQAPGVRAAFARDYQTRGAAGLSNIATPSVARVVAGGPSGVTKKSHSSWSWKNILSGAWDLAKVIAPAVLSLL